MKILDQYIIKQFLKSFFFMFLLFIPIGILVDVSEKIDKFKEHDLGFYEVFNYYLDLSGRSVNVPPVLGLLFCF